VLPGPLYARVPECPVKRWRPTDVGGEKDDFDRGHSRFLFGFGPVYPYYGYHPPDYGYEAPTYWYYCASYGAYYPNVASCPEAWVPVPAS